MVLQNIANYYLNELLSQYIEGYHKDQLNLKFGTVTLDNLRIKLNAINRLDFPVQLKHGFIGNLTLKINFNNLYSQQLSLFLNDIYLIFIPKYGGKYDENLEIQKNRLYKETQLKKLEKTFELIKNEVSQLQNMEVNDSFITKLILQIFNNVQIKINNVHFRFEDNLTNKNTPFSLGITLKSLEFITPLENKPKFKPKNLLSGIFKLAKLTSFGFYLNTNASFLIEKNDFNLINELMKNLIPINESNSFIELKYILQPINFFSNIFIHRKPFEDSFEIPTFDIEMNLDKFHLDFNRNQFKTVLSVVDNLNRLTIAKAYRKWKPEVEIKNNAKIWWKFCITVILETDVRRKRKNWSWSYLKNHINNRKKYKKLYKKKLLSDKKQENLDKLLQKYEDEFDVFNLMLARNQARYEVYDQLKIIELEKQKTLEEKNKSWFNGWWYSNKKEDSKSSSLLEEVKKEFDDKIEKEKLYKAINYDENQTDHTYPIGYAAQKVSFFIKNITFNLYDEEKNYEIAKFLLEDIITKLNILPSSNGISINVIIKSLKMFGMQAQNIPLIEPISIEASKVNVLEIDFDLNPLNKQVKYDYGIKIFTKGLKIIYNMKTINEILSIMKVTENISLEEIQTIASIKLNEFKTRSVLSLEHAIENHKKLNLTLNIEPSFVIIPENGEINKCDNILLISLGQLDINTVLTNYNKNEIQTLIKNSTNDKYEIIRNSAYENYLINFSKIQLILSDKNNWMKDLETCKKTPKEFDNFSRYIIHPISLNVIFSRSIITDDPKMALVKLNACLPEILLSIESNQIINLLKIILSLSPEEINQVPVISKKKSIKISNENIQNEIYKNLVEKIQVKKSDINIINLIVNFTINSLILELKNEKNQLVRCSIKDLISECKLTSKETIIESNLNTLQFFCCMDYYYHINNLQKNVLDLINKNINEKVQDIKIVPTANLKLNVKKVETVKFNKIFIFLFNMSKVDFIMLDDYDNKNAPSIIFNFNLIISVKIQNNITNLNLKFLRTQMAITDLDKYLQNFDVHVFILQPCDFLLNLNLENEIHHISLIIEQIDFNISPNMVQILISMLSKLGNVEKKIEDLNENLKQTIIKKNDLLTPKSLDEKLEKKFRFQEFIKNNNSNIEDENLINLSSEDCLVNAEEILQQIVFQIKSINVIVQSGGTTSKPLIKLNTNLLSKFINYKYINLEMQLYMDYYNEKNYTWEPIIDIIDNNQWSFTAIIQLKENTENEPSRIIFIDLISNSKLEITLTNMALKVLDSLSKSFTNAVYKSEILYKDDETLVINNFTEIELSLYFDERKLEILNSKETLKKIEKNVILKLLKENSSCQLKHIDELNKEKIENFIFFGVKLSELETRQKIFINQTKSYIYYLNNKINRDLDWKLVVNVNVHNNQVKNVDFHSNVVIHNKLNIPFNVYYQKEAKIGNISKNSIYYLPLNVVYGNENSNLYIKPDHSYISESLLFWKSQEVKDGKKLFKNLVCESIEQGQNIYIRYAIYTEKILIEDSKEDYEQIYHFELYPEFLLRNLLPIPITCKVLNNMSDIIELEPGQDNQIYNFCQNSKIHFEIKNYKNKSWYYVKENFNFQKGDTITEIWEFKSLSDNIPESLNLAVNYLNADENDFRLISIFAPFWLINNSSVDLIYNLNDEIFIKHPGDFNDIQLVSFKSKHLTQKKKMQLGLEDSNFSNPFPIDVVGNKGSVVVKMADKSLSFFTIDISLSEILFTKIVKISSFYTIFSRINFDFEVSENVEDWILIKSNSSKALFFKDNTITKLYFRLINETVCSKAISLKNTQTTLLDVNNIMLNIHIEVTNHAVNIEVDNYHHGSTPALIINYTEKLDLIYGQFGENKKYNLHPKSMVYFIWHNPRGNRSLVWFTEESSEQINDLDKDSFGKTDQGNIFYISFLEENQRIFLVTQNNEITKKILKESQLFKPNLNVNVNFKGIGISLFNSIKLKELCYFSVSSSDIIWECKKENSKIFKVMSGKEIQYLEENYQKYNLQKQISEKVLEKNNLIKVGNLVVNFDLNIILQPYKGTLRRISNNGFYLNYSKSIRTTNIHLKLNKIQLDNQLDDYIFSTIFCPVIPPKSITMELSPKPFIELSLILEQHEKRKRFKCISFLIQEFAIQLDLDFLHELQAYFDIVTKKYKVNYLELMNNSKKYALKSYFEDKNETLNSIKNYYDLIHLSPIKMHLSFSLGTIESFHLPGILDYLVKSAGVTIMEFKDAVLKINYFAKENVFLSQEEFLNELIEHYKSQTLNQFFVIVFGLDVIGNPVGLFLGLTQGVGDFFYEPIMGIIQGPEEFAEGLIFGVRSLFSSTVGGAAGALGKMTGQLSQGISSLMETGERKKRRERLNKQQTVLQNSKNLAKELFLGVTGLVSKHMEGVKKSGFEGLVKGVGHGVIGLVAQPTTGIIDFTSETLNQLQRTVNINEEIKRQRLVRTVGPDNVLRSYNSYEATGREILKNLLKGQFFQTDHYIFHKQISKDKIFLVTNNNLLYIKRDFIFKNYEIHWHLLNSNVLSVENKKNYVYFTIKQPKKTLGIFGEKSVFEIICESNEVASLLVGRIKNLIKI